MNSRAKTYLSPLFNFFTIACSSLLAVSSAYAATYYWDADGATPGFGDANGTTWDATGTGNLWSTDATGSSPTAAIQTTTSDDIFLGTADVALGGTVTISGTVEANSVVNASGNLSGTINFSDEGSYIRTKNNGNFGAMTFTGNDISFTWKPHRNLNVSSVDTTSASMIILSTSPTSTYPYPGRTVMGSTANVTLGKVDAPLVFDGGTIRMASGFPYVSLSALDADHPVSFVADQDAGIEIQHTALFTVDMAINLGTGAFWPETSSGVIKLTQSNTWGQINLTNGANAVEVSESAHLGLPEATTPLQFGSGVDGELGFGTLRIAGTTMTDFGTRPLLTPVEATVSLDIAEAAHTFTLDKVLAMGTGDLNKSGAGTLVLTEANTYTGSTNVNAGTLALAGGSSQASAITVASSASLGLTIGATPTPTTTGTADLTNGDVTISNPGAVDGETDYLLMTASSFTFGDIATQLGTAITDYQLELRNTDTELWLVYAPSFIDYATWATDFVDFTDTTNDVDFDKGGLESGIEYVVGGDPTDASDDAGKAPTLSDDGTNMIFTFTRDQVSINANTTVTIEVSTDLSDWTTETYTVGTDTAGSTEGVTVTNDTSPGFDTVTLSVPKAPDDKKFARLQMLVTP